MSARPAEVVERSTVVERAAALVELKNRVYKEDPLAWFDEQVVTQDEATQQAVPWPVDRLYVKDLVWALQHVNLLALPKSRRVLASWTVAAWFTYTARYFPVHALFWQSETEDKAAYVTDKRCVWIEDHLRERPLRLPYSTVKTTKGQIGRITYLGTQSYIWAIPQGDSVIRSYTFSKMAMDESEFQAEGPAALVAALPIAEKGAQLIVLSSSNGPVGVLASICTGAGFTRFK